MTVFYSPAERGFFDTAFHHKDQIPGDAIEVTASQRRELQEAISTGMLVEVTADGLIGVMAPPADPNAGAISERAWRDTELAGLVWLRDRHRDQLEIGVPTTLTPDQFAELLVFMQALRDWPQSQAFPDAEQRPVAPAFLSALEGMQ